MLARIDSKGILYIPKRFISSKWMMDSLLFLAKRYNLDPVKIAANAMAICNIDDSFVQFIAVEP